MSTGNIKINNQRVTFGTVSNDFPDSFTDRAKNLNEREESSSAHKYSRLLLN